jgi:hypothetical protein
MGTSRTSPTMAKYAAAARVQQTAGISVNTHHISLRVGVSQNIARMRERPTQTEPPHCLRVVRFWSIFGYRREPGDSLLERQTSVLAGRPALPRSATLLHSPLIGFNWPARERCHFTLPARKSVGPATLVKAATHRPAGGKRDRTKLRHARAFLSGGAFVPP